MKFFSKFGKWIVTFFPFLALDILPIVVFVTLICIFPSAVLIINLIRLIRLVQKSHVVSQNPQKQLDVYMTVN